MNITRIALSPTGDMHIGTARTAYFNWLAARASGGKFILRVDDTDQKRNDPAYKSTTLLPRDKMLEMFLTSGKMRSQPASFDSGKLESFDRKYKARKGTWRTGDKLIPDTNKEE